MLRLWQQEVQDRDSQEKGNKSNEPYDGHSLQPGGRLQPAVQGWEPTQSPVVQLSERVRGQRFGRSRELECPEQNTKEDRYTDKKGTGDTQKDGPWLSVPFTHVWKETTQDPESIESGC